MWLRKLFGSPWVRWLISVVLIAYAVSKLEMAQINEIASVRGVSLLLCASAVLLVVVFFNAFRWKLVTGILRCPIELGAAYRWTLIGHFFNQILPSSVGGDVVRGVLAARHVDDKAAIVTSLALERLVGLFALAILIAIGQPVLLLRFNDSAATGTVTLLVAGICCLIVLLVSADKLLGRFLRGRIETGVRRLSVDARKFVRARGLVSLTFLVAFMMHCAILVLTTFVANQLGSTISFLEVLLIMPTILLIASLPISVGGWGIREAALAVGFSMLGHQESIAVATSILLGLANFMSAVPGVLLWASSPVVDRGGPELVPTRNS